ncbi:MAG: hypothetical protein LBH44_02995 [Treponema sp.]|jgi:uncharacterized protein (TIGR03545 family)|nr:hypothetical protein [Treponema sp.]
MKKFKLPVNLIPLAFAGAVTASAIIFFSIFANPLLGNAMEKGLEAIFDAKSDVRGFNLSLLRFRIAIGSITVANKDKPMTNLFEMGKTEIRLKPEAVLRGKVYIEEIRADAIRFGTERKTSGALPAKPPKVKQEKPKSDAPPLVDLKNFDAMGLLNREYDKLKTPKLYDEAIDTYNTTLTKWKGEADGAKAKVTELQNAAKPILGLNASSVRDIETITRTVQDITTMANTVQSAADDVGKMVTGIENDINTARRLEQNARTALTDDINHLKSYVDLGSGAAFEALEPFIREVLSDTAEQYLDYGIQALEALEKLKAMSDAKPKTEKPKKQPKVVFKGRDVYFPQKAYPAFYLGILASDFTIDAWNWAFDLRDISSNPDLTGRPVSLTFGLNEESGGTKRNVDFKGEADFRTNPPQRFNAALSGGGFQMRLGNELSKVGINGFTGETSFSVNMSGRTDGGFSTGGDVKIGKPRLVEPKGTLAEALDTAINEAGRIDMGITYNHRIDQSDEFKITTNLADLLARALRRAVEAYAKQAMDEIEKALRQRIEQYIDGRFASKEELDTLFRAARGDKAAIDQTKTGLTNKKNEYEQRVKNMAGDAFDKAKEEAMKQADQAVKDALGGKAPTPQTPTLPKLPGLR